MTREIQLPFERLFDTAPDAMVISNYQGHIVLVNTMAERMLGYSRAELIGQPIEILVPQQHRDGHTLQRHKYYRHPRTRPMGEGRELYAVRKDGSMFSAEISLSPMEVDGHLLITSAIRDITERKQIQKTLEQQAQDLMRSNAELEQFAYVASHDLQEPLRMVSSYAQLLARRYRNQLDSDADEFIEFMVDGATRMQALINDLLAYSRVGTKSKTFTTADSNWVIQQVLGSLQLVIKETQARLSVDPLPILIADEAQLAQLFQNLISNALKFRRETTPRIHISAKAEKNEIIFSVADNGIGIEPQYTERIFLLFQRLHSKREYPGTGIGLAICKKIVECHGGRIWVESRQGAGTTFLFALPLEPNEDSLPST
ncbi:sensor histidine kinase [Nitrosococcus watsonii]|uniref:histidine kinase n=1 Tax=Nitrosococcus watsoni (strain C-113) TaxID=105559 RepID=D8K606_NITWC|nr:PAS domain-containing sensor histidine kinase [Nitrosococcus watsonii]ADJ28333.1 PAS/PAC sensor signal transduction histidine kinase [Nitrosococcus watsonii C-113]